MHNRTAGWVAFVVILGLGTAMSRAQEASNKASAEQRKPEPAYHLDFTLYELESGKKINNRQYGLDLIALRSSDRYSNPSLALQQQQGKEINIGTRMPIETEQNKMEYLEIGTRIRCKGVEDEFGFYLDVRAEVSSISTPADAEKAARRNPMIHDLLIDASTLITPGRPINLGTVDDPDSKRQFQLEVIATKLK